MSLDRDRHAFLERLRLQVQSRYPNSIVTVENARFGLRLQQAGADITLSLAPLHAAVRREPQRTAELIADYVRGVERQITPTVQAAQFSLRRALWCVRSRRYMEELSRAGDLLTTPVGDDMVGFVSETLPGSIMRGVPAEEWRERGIDDDEVRRATDANTAERFARTVERIRGAERIARDGWRLSGDQLFQGSVVLVPEVRRALATAAGGDVLVGIPDRNLLLAVPASSPGADRFGLRVNQAYREAMSPCSRDVLVTDGETIRSVPRSRSRGGLLSWLSA